VADGYLEVTLPQDSVTVSAIGNYDLVIQVYEANTLGGALVNGPYSAYSGTLVSCAVLDSAGNPCFTNNGGCDYQAYCSLSHSLTPTCTCPTGYTGNGYTCTASATCSPSCSTYGYCSYGYCYCDSGYSGDGYVCTYGYSSAAATDSGEIVGIFFGSFFGFVFLMALLSFCLVSSRRSRMNQNRIYYSGGTTSTVTRATTAAPMVAQPYGLNPNAAPMGQPYMTGISVSGGGGGGMPANNLPMAQPYLANQGGASALPVATPYSAGAGMPMAQPYSLPPANFNTSAPPTFQSSSAASAPPAFNPQAAYVNKSSSSDGEDDAPPAYFDQATG